MRKIKLIVQLIFATKYMVLIRNGKKIDIASTFSDTEITHSGKAFYIK